MPRIYITEPNHFYTFELPTIPGAEVLIGTAPHCQLALPGVAGLGEVHASISCQPQGYVMSDMGSPTGTFANGAPIRSEYMMPGVEYRLGAAVITLAAEDVPQQAAPQPVQQAAPQAQMPAPAAAPQPEAAAKKPTLKKKASPLKTGGGAKTPKKDLAGMAAKFDRSRGKSASQATFIYVVILLVVAFYAGIALHHWERTGNCLPGLVSDPQADPAPAKPAAAPAAEATESDSAQSPADDDSAAGEDTPEVDEPTSSEEVITDTEEPVDSEDEEPVDSVDDEPEADEEPSEPEDDSEPEPEPEEE